MKLLALSALLFASVLQSADPGDEIKAVLATQVESWNRGDIPTFVTTYADDCIFVGTDQIQQGRAQLLDRYRKTYPTPDAMGHLAFSDMAVHLLNPEVAIVTAHWHLDRTSKGGGPVGGMFSLVLQHKTGAWKIALDHTS